MLLEVFKFQRGWPSASVSSHSDKPGMLSPVKDRARDAAAPVNQALCLLSSPSSQAFCVLMRGPFPPSVCPHGLGLDTSLWIWKASLFTYTQLPQQKTRGFRTMTRGCCWLSVFLWSCWKAIVITGDWHLFSKCPMPHVLWTIAHSITHSSQQLCEVGTVVIPTSEMRRLRHPHSGSLIELLKVS